MTARIYILPVIRIERGLWLQEFCREIADAKPTPGTRPRLIIDNSARRAPRGRPNFDFLEQPNWWLSA